MNSASKCANSILHACKGQRLQRFMVFSMLLLAFSACAFAQDATIVGTVTDPSGASVPNVAVTLTHAESGAVTQVTSNGEGQFALPALKIGHYTFRAEAQ